jgi:hypothetical protein
MDFEAAVIGSGFGGAVVTDRIDRKWGGTHSSPTSWCFSVMTLTITCHAGNRTKTAMASCRHPAPIAPSVTLVVIHIPRTHWTSTTCT